MRRIGLAVVLTIGLLATPVAVEAQTAPKLPRIGILSAFSPDWWQRPFLVALRELGWIEGQNIMIERRLAEGRLDRLPALATDLVRLNVDLILATGGAEIVAAKYATTTIPIVMAPSLDAVEQGFVASLARPGGNVTGATSMTSEISRKRLELLKETVPKIVRTAILQCKGLPGQQPLPGLIGTMAAARALGVSPQLLEAREADDFEAAFAAAIRERAEATVVLTCYFTALNAPRVVALAARHRLPAMYSEKQWVDAGGLMSYGPSVPDMYRLIASYVDKILKGAKAADLPVGQPTKFELVINLKTARTLGLTIPPSVLGRADQVIE